MADEAMMDAASYFNSSDEGEDEDDWDRTIFAKKSTVGKRQAEAIIANQVADRVASKRNYRKLEYHKGAPSSQDTRTRVEVTWDRFYGGLGVDVTSCPTGETIFRYIDTMTRHVKTHIPGKEIASLSTILSIWEYLISILTFRYDDLKNHYGRQHVLKINVHLDQLVKRGLLWKGAWFKKQWVGYLVVKRIAESWLVRNLTEGCFSWDRTLYKLLGLVLQSALAARCGDIGRSAKYMGTQYLCYSDIKLTLGQTPKGVAHTVQSLTGKFVLRFRKGKKDVTNEDDTLFVDPLKDTTQNATCAIKMLLIVALRFGYVHGTSISEVLQHTAGRCDRIVEWRYPDRPVLCQIKTNSGTLEYEKPAPSRQLTRALKQMALLAGVLERVTSHDIRRGAIRDVAYLKKSIAGVGTAAAALVAGHSKTTEAQGITNRYVGALQAPLYNLRAEAGFVDKLAPSVASSRLELRSSTKREIDAYMDEHGMDKSSSRKRAKAGELLKEARIKQWKTSAANDRVEAASTASNSNCVQAGADIRLPRLEEYHAGKGKTVLPATFTGVIRGSNLQPKTLANSAPHNSKGPNKVDSNPDRLGAIGSEHRDGKYISRDPNIDPRLYDLDEDEDDGSVDQDALEALESLILHSSSTEESATCGSEAGDLLRSHVWDTSAMDDALIQVSLDQALSAPELDQHPLASEPESDPLLLESDRFVDFFASINTVRAGHSSSKLIIRQPGANSRDTPTAFLYHCGLGECTFSTAVRETMTLHQLNCKGNPLASKAFPCLEVGCGRSFGNQTSLGTHMNDIHKWQPRPCSQCLDSDTLYLNINELRRHQDAVHNIFEVPRPCPLACNQDKLYTHPTLLRKHLAIVHHQTVDQIKSLVPAKQPQTKPKTSFDCPFPECTSLTASHSGYDLRLHLVRRHGFTIEAALELIPLSKLAMTKQANKAKAEPKPSPPTWKCPVNDCKTTRTFPCNRDRRLHLRTHKWTEDRIMSFVPYSQREVTMASKGAK